MSLIKLVFRPAFVPKKNSFKKHNLFTVFWCVILVPCPSRPFFYRSFLLSSLDAGVGITALEAAFHCNVFLFTHRTRKCKGAWNGHSYMICIQKYRQKGFGYFCKPASCWNLLKIIYKNIICDKIEKPLGESVNPNSQYRLSH